MCVCVGGGGADEVYMTNLTFYLADFGMEQRIFLHIFATVMPHFIIEYMVSGEFATW